MCGLTFLYSTHLSEAEARERTDKALARMAHRGPDEQGTVVEKGWALGHRRLSIIDLGTSHQPMFGSDKRFYLVYNGELYNYKQLREQLRDKWQFRTSGDTEVVLAGLAVKGSEFLRLMEGMWALALWDRREKRLLVSRDRMGKKPIFYRVTQNGFLCASELPVLRRLDKVDWVEDMDSTADYLRYGYYLPGTTAYLGIREVLPGHWLEWSPRSGVSTDRYWSLQVGGFKGSRSQAKEEIQACLARSIDRRLVADVEVGAFLSGGVDSSLVVALLAERSGRPPKTFTIGFQDKSYDEREYARLVATRYQTDHYEEVLENWDSAWLRRLVLDHVGQPFSDSSILPTALVSELAAKHVKVVLSGDGGDELFSGYQRYTARAILRWYTRIPESLRQPMEKVLKSLPEPFSHHSRSLLKKAHLFLDVVQRHSAETPYIAPVMYSTNRFEVLAPELKGRGHDPPHLPSECSNDDLLQMMVSDVSVYLPQDILVKVDRASMAYSLEARAPFLDRDVVELAFSLPRNWHRGWFSGKRMLKSSFDAYLPSGVLGRRKQGFGVPLGHWFKNGLSDELLQLVKDVPTLLNSEEIGWMIAEHREGKRDFGHRLWQLYIYFLWRHQIQEC